jgi:hypothetical protein
MIRETESNYAKRKIKQYKSNNDVQAVMVKAGYNWSIERIASMRKAVQNGI